MTLTKRLLAFLDSHNVTYKTIEHEPTRTSEQSAKARGLLLRQGAKALLVKGDTGFLLCVIPADKKLNLKLVRHVTKTRKLRMATEEELKQVTGCDKGAVPPFGPLMKLDMIVDTDLFAEEIMGFNAGSLTLSVIMTTADYNRILKPRKEYLHA